MRKLKKWHEKEEAKLIQLYKDGLKLPEIAKQLGRTKDSVAHRIALLKESNELSMRVKKHDMQTAYYKTSLNTIQKFIHQKTYFSELSAKNHELLKAYDDENFSQKLTFASRAGILTDVVYVLRTINKSVLRIKKEDLVDFFVNYLEKGNKTNTKKSRLKFFYAFLLDKFPKNKNIYRCHVYLSHKERGKKNNKEKEKVDTQSRLTKKEVVSLVSAIKGRDAIAIRDKALLAALYDTGARRSEMVSVRVKDVQIDGDYPKIYLPESKTIPRDSPMLNFALPYLMDYMKQHEYLNNPEAPFFYSLSTSNFGEPIGEGMIQLVVKRAARIAGIKKTVSPHILRDSKIVHVAQDNAGEITPAEANDLFGWGRSSGMFNYYSKVTKDELERREKERQGKLTDEEKKLREEEKKAFYEITCKRCGTDIRADEFICSKCGLPRNATSAKEYLERDKEYAMMKKDLEQLKKMIIEKAKDEIIQKKNIT